MPCSRRCRCRPAFRSPPWGSTTRRTRRISRSAFSRGEARRRLPWSLAGRRLPQFYLVSFWIDDPGKLPVLGIVDLLEHVAAFCAQDFDQGVEILHPVVDHERCSAGRKLVTLRRTNRPDGCAGNRLTIAVGPGERRATPCLDIDAEVPLVPRLQCRGVFGFEEDAADAGDSFRRTSELGLANRAKRNISSRNIGAHHNAGC